MDELLAGVMHWSAVHPKIKQRVHSAFLADSGTLIDPMVPEEGLEWFASHPPERILLTNRHHARGADEYRRAFGAEVQRVAPGDNPASGVRVLAFGAITPEEIALLIDTGPGVLALGDSVIRGGDGRLAFVPDRLLGDDPEAVKAGILARARAVLSEERFDALLLAHGAPAATGGRAQLERFLAEAGS